MVTIAKVGVFIIGFYLTNNILIRALLNNVVKLPIGCLARRPDGLALFWFVIILMSCPLKLFLELCL
jgi:hypothetical protein